MVKELKETYYKECIKRYTKEILKEIFINKKIYIDRDGEKVTPRVLKIELDQYIKIFLDVAMITHLEELEEIKEYIRFSFKAQFVELEEEEGKVNLYIYKEKLKDKQHKRIKLKNTQLLLGYNYRENLIVDMEKTPHLLVCGLSNSGKTQLVKTVINNLENVEIVILNAFRKDFKNFKGQFLQEETEIRELLQRLLEQKKRYSKPIYLVVDEVLVLVKNKEINKLITDLLAIARHYNVYIIAISQLGTKEQLKFKDLFNCRICMKCIEKSYYNVVLGCSVDKKLKEREFYLYSTSLKWGKTFINLD